MPQAGSGFGADAQRGGTGQQTGNGFVGRVKETATAQLTTQKDRGTSALDSVVQAVRSTTGKLREDKHDMIANSLEQAASQIETWSHRLRDKDVGELLTDVQRLARRQPGLFIGSAFALGVVGARFLKSSRQRDDFEYDTTAAGQRMSGGSAGGYSGDATRTYSGDATRSDAASIPYGSSTASDTSGVGGNRTTRATRGRKSGTQTE
jgi:hypothetical protein